MIFVFSRPNAHTRGPVRAIALCMLILFLTGNSSPVRAELILSAGAGVTYEDNIVGLLSGGGIVSPLVGAPQGMQGILSMQPAAKGFGTGPGTAPGQGGSASGGEAAYLGAGSQSPGDLSVTVKAELGVSGRSGGSFTFYALGYAEKIDYQEFSEYDQAAASMNAGATVLLGDAFSASLSGSGGTRYYENDPVRDGKEYSGTASLKQYITDDLWFREAASYNVYRAELQDFSNRGTSCRLASGYDLTDNLLVTAGYRFQSRQYQDTADTVLRTRTLLLGGDYDLTDHWSAWLAYERQTTHPGTSDVITRNNMFTLSLGWDY